VSAWRWQDRAACHGKDLGLFFGTEAERYDQGAKDRREAAARAVCASCPVAAECLAYAVSRPEKHGTWGGMTEDELAAERRRRTRRALTAQRREQVAS
jgi:WhiB family redox-sensing transcriptional regulator